MIEIVLVVDGQRQFGPGEAVGGDDDARIRSLNGCSEAPSLLSLCSPERTASSPAEDCSDLFDPSTTPRLIRLAM